jgi:uncharacterized protein YoxC
MAENESSGETQTSRYGDVSQMRAELIGLEVALTKFAKSFESSAHRWEMLVYPAVLVFFILGASGFYLIYSLTKDMSTLAQNVDPQMALNMGTLSNHMATLSRSVAVMSDRVSEMTTTVDTMTQHVENIDVIMADISRKLNTMEPLLANIADMNLSMRAMTSSAGVMSRDMSQMNYNIGRPMSFMNMFSPW